MENDEKEKAHDDEGLSHLAKMSVPMPEISPIIADAMKSISLDRYGLSAIKPIVEPSWMKDLVASSRAIAEAIKPISLERYGLPIAKSLAQPGWMKGPSGSSSVLQSIVDSTKAYSEVLLPVMNSFKVFQNALLEQVRPLESYLTKHSEEIASFTRDFHAYPGRVKEGLLVMGKHGWYLDMEMESTKPIRFKEADECDLLSDAEADMVEHFEWRLDAIREELIHLYPKRSIILNAAFDAHKSGHYLLSIPALFAQVDGICFDVLNHHFFMGGDRKKMTERVMGVASTNLAKAFLAPFEGDMAVTLSEKNRPRDFNGLNRHMVLHGESVDYGTKENSLKAISLLNYISQSLQMTVEESGASKDEPITIPDA
jgi:hypothetical protein